MPSKSRQRPSVVAAAAKIKNKNFNNSSFFKVSLKANNKALAVDLAALRTKIRRLQICIVKLQKLVLDQNFHMATMRHKERKLMLILKGLNTLYDVGTTTDPPDDKLPQSGSGCKSAAEQGNTMLLDTDMELTASDTVLIIQTVTEKKKNTQVGRKEVVNSGKQSKAFTDQGGGNCAVRNPETQRKPTGTFLQKDNYTEEVQPCVQRRIIPRNSKLRQPQACDHLKMAKINNACDPPETLAISAISNGPNIVTPVLDDCVMDPVMKSSRAKESAKHLSEREIPEDSGTLILSREVVLEVPVAIPAEASTGVRLKSLTNTTTARDKGGMRERRRTGAFSRISDKLRCREIFVVPANNGCSSPNGVPALVPASTTEQDFIIPGSGYSHMTAQSETVGNAIVGKQHCDQNLPAFPAIDHNDKGFVEETQDTFRCSAEELGISEDWSSNTHEILPLDDDFATGKTASPERTPVDVSCAELDCLVSVPKGLTAARETVIPDEASPAGRESEDNTMASDDAALRPRRRSCNYKLQGTVTQLQNEAWRQITEFTDTQFLHSPVFKTTRKNKPKKKANA